MSETAERPILRSVEVINVAGLTDEELSMLAQMMQEEGVETDRLIIFTSNSTLKASVTQEETQTVLAITVDEIENFDEFACLMENLIQLQDYHHMLSLSVENLSDKPMVANLPLNIAAQLIERQNETKQH